MDLIQMTQIVNENDKNRSKLLGQKEMLMKGLNDIGFKTVKAAKNESAKLKKQTIKMKTSYDKGEEKFKTDFAHLLT